MCYALSVYWLIPYRNKLSNQYRYQSTETELMHAYYPLKLDVELSFSLLIIQKYCSSVNLTKYFTFSTLFQLNSSRLHQIQFKCTTGSYFFIFQIIFISVFNRIYLAALIQIIIFLYIQKFKNLKIPSIMSQPIKKSSKKNVEDNPETFVRQKIVLKIQAHNECPTVMVFPIIPEAVVYPYNKEEKIIPGYNYQSLFRKKSHIRLAKKKIKEESLKKNLDAKDEDEEKQSKNLLKGHWTNEENKLYHWFLEIHSEHFINKHLRRTDKIFKSMANFIKTREAEQCRSHHQKMQKKYQSFYEIVVKLRHEFYNGTDPEQILGDIKQNGYEVKGNRLLTQLQLKNSSNRKEIDGQLSREESEQQKSSDDKGNDNILDENYQIGLNFHNVHY